MSPPHHNTCNVLGHNAADCSRVHCDFDSFPVAVLHVVDVVVGVLLIVLLGNAVDIVDFDVSNQLVVFYPLRIVWR